MATNFHGGNGIVSVIHFNMQLPTLSELWAILMGKQTAVQSQLVISIKILDAWRVDI